jgi:hypothetical protein
VWHFYSAMRDETRQDFWSNCRTCAVMKFDSPTSHNSWRQGRRKRTTRRERLIYYYILILHSTIQGKKREWEFAYKDEKKRLSTSSFRVVVLRQSRGQYILFQYTVKWLSSSMFNKLRFFCLTQVAASSNLPLSQVFLYALLSQHQQHTMERKEKINNEKTLLVFYKSSSSSRKVKRNAFLYAQKCKTFSIS